MSGMHANPDFQVGGRVGTAGASGAGLSGTLNGQGPVFS